MKQDIALAIPSLLCDSPLMAKGGFEVFAGLVTDRARERMLAEAAELWRHAHATDVPVSDGEEVRGGSPARRFLSVGAGEAQEEFCGEPWLTRFLCEVSGTTLSPTGRYGTYTYYARPGDHLAIHRDIVSCDVAVITALSDNAPPGDLGGASCVYPHRLCEPLSAIRRSPEQGALRFRLWPGQTLVMFGGIVPHAILPVGEGQVRIVSVLCFQVRP
jgi:hypothetical protein